MSLVNTNIVDLTAGTVTFSSVSGATTVEGVVFNSSTNQITFSAIPGLSVTKADFFTLLNQLSIFETAIIYNFTPGVAFISPFNSFVSTEHYISFTNAWSLTCNESGGSNLISYYGTASDSMVAISSRPSPLTIPFSEWVMLLASQKHYETSLGYFLP